MSMEIKASRNRQSRVPFQFLWRNYHERELSGELSVTEVAKLSDLSLLIYFKSREPELCIEMQSPTSNFLLLT